MFIRLIRLPVVFTVTVGLLNISVPAQETDSDSLLKLAIFTPQAMVFDHPNGKRIGRIERGRVIELLSSQERWLNFTNKEYQSAWIRWEDTVSLKDWANAPPFDSVQIVVLAWEKGIEAIDREVEEALSRIVALKDNIAEGNMEPVAGVAVLEREREGIEESFRRTHDLDTPLELKRAVEVFGEKRWAIDMGLKYLAKYIREGDPVSAVAAGKYFLFAENRVYWYTRELFRVKSKYKLYDAESSIR